MQSMPVLAVLVVAVAACAAPRVRPPSGPRDIALDGEANGLVWDGGALFVADAQHERLLRWDGKEGFAVVAALPAGGNGLGQPVHLADGGFLVPRFGHGENGGLFVVAPDGTARVREGLDPKRKRVGLAVAGDGTVYEAYFISHDVPAGIATIAADGSEHDVVSGLGKPIGLQIRGEWLTYSDQEKNEVRRCRLPACDKPQALAAIIGPDLLAVDESGAVFVGTKDGALWRIGIDGAKDLLANDLGNVRGVAIDDAGDRIFIAGRRNERSFIRILPLGS